MSVWRAREAKNAETYGSARWAEAREIEQAGLLEPDGVVLGRFERAYLRHDLYSPTATPQLSAAIPTFMDLIKIIVGGAIGAFSVVIGNKAQ